MGPDVAPLYPELCPPPETTAMVTITTLTPTRARHVAGDIFCGRWFRVMNRMNDSRAKPSRSSRTRW